MKYIKIKTKITTMHVIVKLKTKKKNLRPARGKKIHFLRRGNHKDRVTPKSLRIQKN